MSASTSKLPATLARTLDQVRRSHLSMKLAEFPILLVAGVAAAGCFQALADRVFDLPWGVRLVFFLLDIAGIGWLAWRFAFIPWKKRLDRKGAALLVERGIPELRSSLISTVELSTGDVPPQSRLLVQQLVAETVTRVKGMKVAGVVVRPDRVKRLAKWMLVPLVTAVLLLVLGWPVSGLLVRRILLSSAALPAATTVVSVTKDLTVEEGDELVLTASADGVVPPDGRLVISRQGKPDDTILVTLAKPGSREYSATLKNVREPFHYRFELNDGKGPKHAVSVHTPPAVKETRFFVTYPGYTRQPELELKASSLKLLEGSSLRVEGTATKKLSSATIAIKKEEASSTVNFALKNNGEGFSTKLPDVDSSWKSLSIHLVGTERDESVKDPVFPLQIIPDRPPQVGISQPKGDSITVVATETVTITGNVSDDFGLAWVGLHYRVLRPKLDGGFDDSEAGRIPFTLKPDERSTTFHLDWNLSRLNPAITAGTRIVFWIEARDTNPANGPAARRNLPPGQEPGTSRSPERTITIVSEDDKRMELLDEFGRKAAELERLYDTQKEINDRLNIPRR